MEELKFKSQICTTIEQSKRLLELGLKHETADMVHMEIDGSWICITKQGDEEDLPYDLYYAWSLHRLIELCPETIYFEETYYDNEVYCSLHIEDKDRIVYHDYGSNVYNFDKHRNIYNNIIDCINWLIKGGNFNKKYLK